MHNGRTPPALPTVTLPDSGYTVEIRSLGPTTLQAIGTAVRKENPEPEPPMNEVVGLDGQPALEANAADPDYQATLAAHQTKVNGLIGVRLLGIMQEFAVIYDIDSDVLAMFRSAMSKAGVELDEDDRKVWWEHFILNSEQDAKQLMGAVLRRSQPTEEAIREKVADFPGDVQAA